MTLGQPYATAPPEADVTPHLLQNPQAGRHLVPPGCRTDPACRPQPCHPCPRPSAPLCRTHPPGRPPHALEVREPQHRARSDPREAPLSCHLSAGDRVVASSSLTGQGGQRSPRHTAIAPGPHTTLRPTPALRQAAAVLPPSSASRPQLSVGHGWRGGGGQQPGGGHLRRGWGGWGDSQKPPRLRTGGVRGHAYPHTPS